MAAGKWMGPRSHGDNHVPRGDQAGCASEILGGGGKLEDRMEGGRGKGWSRGPKRLGREWEPSYGRRLGKTSALRPEASNEWAGPW